MSVANGRETNAGVKHDTIACDQYSSSCAGCIDRNLVSLKLADPYSCRPLSYADESNWENAVLTCFARSVFAMDTISQLKQGFMQIHMADAEDLLTGNHVLICSLMMNIFAGHPTCTILYPLGRFCHSS
ncbi:hypothetical protein N7507_003401 [Penicillium longicatenatum]|nr:hypothetical protein N7507_003401 [Penicillium longicatenatum]